MKARRKAKPRIKAVTVELCRLLDYAREETHWQTAGAFSKGARVSRPTAHWWCIDLAAEGVLENSHDVFPRRFRLAPKPNARARKMLARIEKARQFLDDELKRKPKRTKKSRR